MASEGVFSKLRHFDAYPKTLEDFRTKTYGGAVITIVSSLIMVILFISELNFYLTVSVNQELIVDTTRGQKMKIFVDITFPKLGCPILSIDAMDVSGESQIDVISNVLKQRLDLDGNNIDEEAEKHELGDQSKDMVEAINKTRELDPNRCESCYGAENEKQKCCNTCDDVREAYRVKGWAFGTGDSIDQCTREGYTQKLTLAQNEGCRIHGFVLVNKVAGNFHIAPGRSFQQSHVHVHDLNILKNNNYNTSHVIHHIGFGDDYPGLINPLDSTKQTTDSEMAMFSYYIKIVPTVYHHLNGDLIYTNQFSVTKHTKNVGVFTGESGLPGAFFIYEFSPMMVKYHEKTRSFFLFLTSVCAIIGGVFTVAGIVDTLMYHSVKAIQHKIEIGKVN